MCTTTVIYMYVFNFLFIGFFFKTPPSVSAHSHLDFWFLVWYAATRLSTESQQRCTQVVYSNKEDRKRLTESNGTPAMDLGRMNVG